MKAIRYIVGILAMLFGIVFLCFPAYAVKFCGWMLALVFLIAGIAIIISYTRNKEGKKTIMSTGMGMLIFGIVLIIFSILALFIPAIQAAFEMVVVVMFVISLITSGINILCASSLVAGPAKVLSVITGVMLLIVGFYGIVSLFYAAVAFSVYMGISFIAFGISLLFGTRNVSDINE